MDLSCFFFFPSAGCGRKATAFFCPVSQTPLQLCTHLSHQSKIVCEFRFMHLSLLPRLRCSRKLIWKAIGIKWWFTTFMALQWFHFPQQHPYMFKCSWCYVIVSFCYCVQILMGWGVSRCKLKIQEILHTEVRGFTSLGSVWETENLEWNFIPTFFFSDIQGGSSC